MCLQHLLADSVFPAKLSHHRMKYLKMMKKSEKLFSCEHKKWNDCVKLEGKSCTKKIRRDSSAPWFCNFIDSQTTINIQICMRGLTINGYGGPGPVMGWCEQFSFKPLLQKSTFDSSALFVVIMQKIVPIWRPFCRSPVIQLVQLFLHLPLSLAKLLLVCPWCWWSRGRQRRL